MRILTLLAVLAFLSGCSTIDRDLALDDGSPEGVVLVTGVTIETPRTGYAFTRYNQQAGYFDYETTFSIYRNVYVSDRLTVEDENGEPRLSHDYFMTTAKPGFYARTGELTQTVQFVGDETLHVTGHDCRRRAQVFPVLPGRVNIIDISRPAPDADDEAAYRADYAVFRQEFPNVTAPLAISRSIGEVSFFGEDTEAASNIKSAFCPLEATGFTRRGEDS